MNIYLTGFMGAGKTSVGKLLADKLSRVFIEMDEKIVQKEGVSINEIFSLKGEAYFRQAESEILGELD